MENDKDGFYFLGKFIGFLVVYLALTYPIMVAINTLFSPALLGVLFGGYATFWKTFAFIVLVKTLR